MPVNNMEYDVLTVLQSKLEALAAYDKYMKDCDEFNNSDCRRLFEELKRDDDRHVERLREMLNQIMGQTAKSGSMTGSSAGRGR